MKKPRSGARTKAGYITADTRQSEVVISPLAAAGYRDYRSIRAGMSVARRMQVATSVAPRSALGRPLQHAQGHVWQASRIGSMNGHRLVSGIL
ncbi:MAG: hypothetical protein WB991_13755, partial [Candidatus Sulfotelmatobacter sp.]